MYELTPDAVLPLLRGRLGRPYQYVDSCASTQQLFGGSEPEGAVAVADHQTQGRGRLGRAWEDTSGRGILMSVLLRPAAPVSHWPVISVIAGEAVAQALRA